MSIRDDAVAALAVLDPGMAREQWVRVAFALKDCGVDEGTWLEWCEGGGNFNEVDARTTWRNAKPMAGGVTSATLFGMARERGWKPEPGGNGATPPPRAAPAQARAPRTPQPPPPDPRPIWEACRELDVHPYTARKRIKANGARVNSGGALVVPYWRADGSLATLQMIQPDGTKRFLAGARQKGSVATLGEVDGAAVAVIVEGWATGCTVHEATVLPVLVAGSRGTLPDAARIGRLRAPQARLVIAADRGDMAAPMAAARAVAGFLALPGPEDAPDGHDFNDWRNAGATADEIRERIEHAHPMEPEEGPASPEPPPQGVVSTAPSPARLALSAYLVDHRGSLVCNLTNLTRWLVSGAAGEFRHDVFTGVSTWNGTPLDEVRFGAITMVVQSAVVEARQPFLKVSTLMVMEAVGQAAAAHEFNSSADWLESLKPWDGTPRIEAFFADVADCERSDYTMAVGRYFWLSMVQRMVTPGTKADATVTLVGAQGVGKSSLARIIGGERYGELSLIDVGSRDWCAMLRGKILMEISELSGHSRAELETLKAAMSRQVDQYRPAYARTTLMVPRGCIFMASTNERAFLVDASGNRRWLPLDVRASMQLDGVRRNREQLFAEAFALVRAGVGEEWWRVPGSLEMQAAHVADDPWIDALDAGLRTYAGDLPERVPTLAVYAVLKIPTERQTGGGTGRRVAGCMRALGYEPARWREPGRIVRGFARTPSDTPAN